MGATHNGMRATERTGERDGSEECIKHVDRSQKAGRSWGWKFLLEQPQGERTPPHMIRPQASEVRDPEHCEWRGTREGATFGAKEVGLSTGGGSHES